jgi:hypothetical protein
MHHRSRWALLGLTTTGLTTSATAWTAVATSITHGWSPPIHQAILALAVTLTICTAILIASAVIYRAAMKNRALYRRETNLLHADVDRLREDVKEVAELTETSRMLRKYGISGDDDPDPGPGEPRPHLRVVRDGDQPKRRGKGGAVPVAILGAGAAWVVRSFRDSTAAATTATVAAAVMVVAVTAVPDDDATARPEVHRVPAGGVRLPSTPAGRVVPTGEGKRRARPSVVSSPVPRVAVSPSPSPSLVVAPSESAGPLESPAVPGRGSGGSGPKTTKPVKSVRPGKPSAPGPVKSRPRPHPHGTPPGQAKVKQRGPKPCGEMPKTARRCR